MKRIISVCSGAVLMLTLPTQASAATNSIQLSGAYLNELAELMRTNHPALRAAASRVRAADQSATAVRTWDDPELMLGGMLASREMRAEEGDLLYGIRQPLPLFGKPAALRSAALAGAAVALAEADLRYQFLRRDMAVTAFQAALAQHIVGAAVEDVAWLEALAETARARHASGAGDQLEVLRIENELARRREELQTERLARGHDEFALNRFLNQPLDTPWPVLELPAPADPIFYNREVVGMATRFEPMIQVFRRQIEAAEADTGVARRAARPEVSVGLEGRNYTGNGNFRQGMVTLGISLPWLNRSRYRADIARTESLREALERELADQELATRQEVHELVIRIDDGRRRALVQRDEIIPRTRAMLESAYAAWVAGGGSTRDLLEIRRLLVAAELDYYRAVTAQYQAMAELILCCGLEDLEALAEVGAQPDVVINESSTPPQESQP